MLKSVKLKKSSGSDDLIQKRIAIFFDNEEAPETSESSSLLDKKEEASVVKDSKKERVILEKKSDNIGSFESCDGHESQHQKKSLDDTLEDEDDKEKNNFLLNSSQDKTSVYGDVQSSDSQTCSSGKTSSESIKEAFKEERGAKNAENVVSSEKVDAAERDLNLKTLLPGSGGGIGQNRKKFSNEFGSPKSVGTTDGLTSLSVKEGSITSEKLEVDNFLDSGRESNKDSGLLFPSKCTVSGNVDGETCPGLAGKKILTGEKSELCTLALPVFDALILDSEKSLPNGTSFKKVPFSSLTNGVISAKEKTEINADSKSSGVYGDNAENFVEEGDKVKKDNYGSCSASKVLEETYPFGNVTTDLEDTTEKGNCEEGRDIFGTKKDKSNTSEVAKVSPRRENTPHTDEEDAVDEKQISAGTNDTEHLECRGVLNKPDITLEKGVSYFEIEI